MKKCPFCKGDPKLVVEKSGGITSHVECMTCGAEGPWFWMDNEELSIQAAIVAWDRRDGEQKTIEDLAERRYGTDDKQGYLAIDEVD